MKNLNVIALSLCSWRVGDRIIPTQRINCA